MSYLQEMRAIAVSVHTLLTTKEELDPAETELAIAGHSTLVELLREVTDDVAQWGADLDPAPHVWPTMDRHPVAQFHKLLGKHVQIRTEKISTILATAPLTTKGRAWQQILIAGSNAQASWRNMPTSLRPVGDELWSHLAELAPAAEALTHLDHDLANHLVTVRRRDDAVRLRSAARSHLAIASREVAYLAAGGDLPRLAELGPETLRVLGALTPAALPDALSRMGHRLVSGGPLSPDAVMVAIRSAAMSATAAATVLEAAGLVPTAQRLQQLAKDLQFAQRLRNYAASTIKMTPQSTEQGRQIQQLLLGMGKRKETLPILDALATAKQLPVTVAQIRDAVDQQFRSHQWFVQRQAKALNWGPTRIGETPVVLHKLQTTATSAERLSQVMRDVHPYAPPPLTPLPREIVRDALNRRGPPARPGLPGLARYVQRSAKP